MLQKRIAAQLVVSRCLYRLNFIPEIELPPYLFCEKGATIHPITVIMNIFFLKGTRLSAHRRLTARRFEDTCGLWAMGTRSPTGPHKKIGCGMPHPYPLPHRLTHEAHDYAALTLADSFDLPIIIYGKSAFPCLRTADVQTKDTTAPRILHGTCRSR